MHDDQQQQHQLKKNLQVLTTSPLVPHVDARPAMASSTAEGIILTPEMCLQRSRERYLRSLEAHRVFIRDLRNSSASGADALDSAAESLTHGSVDLHEEYSFELMQRVIELQVEHSVTAPTTPKTPSGRAATKPQMLKTPSEKETHQIPCSGPLLTTDAPRDSPREATSSPKATEAAMVASSSAPFQPFRISNYHQQLEILREESHENFPRDTDF